VKYVLWALAVIAGLIVVVMIVGALLPEKHLAAR